MFLERDIWYNLYLLTPHRLQRPQDYSQDNL